MEKKISYTYGPGCVFMGDHQPSASRREAFTRAYWEGYGFIMEHVTVNGRTRRRILAWDMIVLTYNEALALFAEMPQLVQSIESLHCSRGYKVFLAAPIPEEEGSVDVFPFDLVDEMKIMCPRELYREK